MTEMPREDHKPFRRPQRYSQLLLAAWTLAILSLMGLFFAHERVEIEELAKAEARVTYERDILLRRWGAMHGGVYVPISAASPPNPWLKAPERELVTPSGRQLTLINPAYMVRQLHEMQTDPTQIISRITSLKPLNPDNAPDPWEREGLERLAAGEREISSVLGDGDGERLRLLLPLFAEKPCLRCHADQGYHEGDLRGGISVSVPLAELRTAGTAGRRTVLAGMGGLWLSGLLLIVAVDRRLRRRMAAQQAAEGELLAVRNELLSFFDSMPTQLIGLDAAGRVTRWNRQVAAATGVAADDAVGRRVTELLPDFNEWIGYLLDRGGDASARLERILIQHGSEAHWYDLLLFPLHGGAPTTQALRIEDVTDQAQLQELMIQTEKLSSLGGLAAGMAHEINNPLGIVSQSAQLVERRLDPQLPANRETAERLGLDLTKLSSYLEERQIDKLLAAIRESVGRAAHIILNLLQYSRRTTYERAPASLVEIMEKALELAGSDYDLKKQYDFRAIAIDRDYAPDVPAVETIAVEIEQVLLNLLRNAAQAMSANPPERRPRLVLRLRREERWGVIEVEDNGPGMTEEVRKRVFEPFFTTKPPGIGTGLGLSVAHTIIHNNHGGRITVRTAPDAGTKFTIFLPLEQPEVTAGETQD